MVQPPGCANSSPIRLPAPTYFQQEDAKPASLPGYIIRILYGNILALRPQATGSVVDHKRTCRALLTAHGLRYSRLVPG
jgi:hypothetical protein